MIKKLQSLKKKKGFTLVELIVVIAIIGVLATILVPTMLGYVTSSRITSANSTASSLRSSINSFITSMDSAGTGIKRSTTASTWTITVNGGTVIATPNASDLTSSASSYTYTATNSKVDGSCNSGFAGKFADMIANDYTFTDAAVTAYIQNGQCIGVVYYAGNTMPSDIPADTDFTAGTYAWDSANDVGVKGGEIIGTNPDLKMS